MQQNSEILISRAKLSHDRKHLYLYTRSFDDCGSLWSELYGQLIDGTEGRLRILYTMPEDPPKSLVLNIESDLDQLMLLLEYLEVELKAAAYLPAGTTERIRQQLTSIVKSNIELTFFGTSTNPTIQQEVSILDEGNAGMKKNPH